MDLTANTCPNAFNIFTDTVASISENKLRVKFPEVGLGNRVISCSNSSSAIRAEVRNPFDEVNKENSLLVIHCVLI